MTNLKGNPIRDSVKNSLEESRFEKYDYDKYMKSHAVSEEEYNKQRMTKFEYEPLISVMTEIGQGKVTYLGDMIESVIAQTYSNTNAHFRSSLYL